MGELQRTPTRELVGEHQIGKSDLVFSRGKTFLRKGQLERKHPKL